MRRRSLPILFICLALASACATDQRVTSGFNPDARLELPLTDLLGKPVPLTRYRDRVVVLALFATWCMPCLAEVPLFNGLHERYGPDGLQVLGVSFDLTGAEILIPFQQQFEVRYPLAMAGQALTEGRTALGRVPVLPTTLLLDRQGRVQARWNGLVPPAELEAAVRDALED